ncbi:MAG: gliding motility-associated C-terminal domain-containing protein [Bacteroidales bacterium]
MTRLILIFLLGMIPMGIFSQVVINEVHAGAQPNPLDFSFQPTTNANSLYSVDQNMQPPYNREYIELFNTHPCDTADIGCYTIGSNANSTLSGLNWGAFTFPQGTKIPPLGYMIIGGNDAPVPFNDFNITQYRQNSFNVQYLCGDNTRWFLRDAWGWIALYDGQGAPVDAVYWNDWPGTAASLFVEEEYQNPIVNITACGGTKTHLAASAIPGIEYVGNIFAGTNTSFQRETDGSMTWYATPVPLTPRGPNGAVIGPPAANYTITAAYCGASDGSVTVQIISGGTGPYTVYWNGSSTPGPLTLSNLPAGVVTIKIQDSYDCLNVFDTIIIPDDPGPDITFSNVTNETCSGVNGAIDLQISGGIPPYQVEWNQNPLITSTSLSGLPAGVYSVTVGDSRGCFSTDSVEIINHKEPALVMSLLSPDSCGRENGAAFASVTGDYHPYSYSWNTSPVQSDSVAINLIAGIYSVTVTDGVCTAYGQIGVPLIPAPVAEFNLFPAVVYLQDGVVTFSDQSQGQINGWLWDFRDGDMAVTQHPVHKFNALGTFDVLLTVFDANGCVASVSHPVTVKDITAAYFPNAFTPDFDGLNDVFKPVGIYITRYRLEIFDRWGRMVFLSEDPEVGWDGTLEGKQAPEGVYVWSARFNHDYGEDVTRDLHMYGTVTLIR